MADSQIRLGTRGSALARWQAEWVATQLTRAGSSVTLIKIETRGDRHQNSVADIGSPGVFTKEIQRALLDDRIDLAVHSLKDLPTDEVAGLCLAAVPSRAVVGDVLIAPMHGTLANLPAGAVIGTGSLRRQAQLLHMRPDLRVEGIRGNVGTRLQKLSVDRCDADPNRADPNTDVSCNANPYDAIVLAEAGLLRLELTRHITERLPSEIMMPAVGQGALGLETRNDDDTTQQVVAQLDDRDTHRAVVAERAMLAALQGGCLAPIGACGRVERGRLVLAGRVLSHNGVERLDVTLDAEVDDAVALGRRVAEALLGQGASRLIASSRGG